MKLDIKELNSKIFSLGDGLIPSEKIEKIARVVHEANRAWCIANGDFSQPPWDKAEQWMREATLAAIRYRMSNPDAPASEQHDQWLEEKRASGWRYGPIKDSKAKTHPMLIPYQELPEYEKEKDSLVIAIINALAPET